MIGRTEAMDRGDSYDRPHRGDGHGRQLCKEALLKVRWQEAIIGMIARAQLKAFALFDQLSPLSAPLCHLDRVSEGITCIPEAESRRLHTVTLLPRATASNSCGRPSVSAQSMALTARLPPLLAASSSSSCHRPKGAAKPQMAAPASVPKAIMGCCPAP